jgi:hypothetical protein
LTRMPWLRRAVYENDRAIGEERVPLSVHL